MFVRTPRLTLRPGWIEDAPELARAIAHESVVRMLGRVPWPYALGDAQSFLSRQRPLHEPQWLIFAHEDVGRPRLVGGIGICPLDDEPHEFGYWLTPDAWGRGYATEAGLAAVAAARDTIRLPHLAAGHFVDNPASARVLHKLGFRPTGCTIPFLSRGRSGEVACVRHQLLLADQADGGQRMAA